MKPACDDVGAVTGVGHAGVGRPTRRAALGLAGGGLALLAVGPAPVATDDIVIVDGWVLSPSDLAAPG